MIKNIIFDLDGTLANTHKDIIFSLNYALNKAGVEKKINFKKFKNIANRGSFYMIKKISNKKTRFNKKINDHFLDHYKLNICNKTTIKKGVINFLKKCKKKKICLYVSTNKKQQYAKLVLKKLKLINFFKFVAGSDTFKYQKPNPLHLEALRNKFNFKKNQTVFIGDTEVDSKLADQFNIKFILVKNGYTNLRISQIKSDFKIVNYSNISRIFSELSRLS